MDDMAQLFWSHCILFLMVSYHGSGEWADSCTSTGMFFPLQFCKSGSLKTYMYMCIKYMYIKIMLFKYLHIKPRDWLASQNYWNYLPQEHLDLRNLYSNTFLLKLNNLWKEWLALHPLLFVWVLLLGVVCTWVIHFLFIMIRFSFIAFSPTVSHWLILWQKL